jgi:hypothetical protein
LQTCLSAGAENLTVTFAGSNIAEVLTTIQTFFVVFFPCACKSVNMLT